MLLISLFWMMFRAVFAAFLKLIAMITVAVLVLTLLQAGLEALWQAPWAYPFGGRPVLVGSWVGRFRAPNGTSGVVYLDLRHSVGEATRRHDIPKLHGEGRWCFAGGTRRAFKLSGTANANASRITIFTESDRTDRTRIEGVYFARLTGSWTSDRLQLAGTADTFHDGKRLTSRNKAGEIPATEFAMQRGSALVFESACRESQ